MGEDAEVGDIAGVGDSAKVGDGAVVLEPEDGVAALELDEDAGRRRKGMMSPSIRCAT